MIEMSFIGLRYKTLEPLLPEEWNLCVKALDMLYQRVEEVAIDCAKIEDVHKDLLELISMKRVELLDYVINKFVYLDTDIFDADVEILRSGRAIIRVKADKNVLVRVKWTPSGVGTTLLGYLNAGAELPSDAFNDLEFTVEEGDKINVRVIPDSTVTVLIYNVGEL